MENQKFKSQVMASLVARVQQNITEYFVQTGSLAEPGGALRQVFLAGPRNGPPPEDRVEERHYEDQYDKVYLVADALRAELAQRKGFDEEDIYLLIDPCDVRGAKTIYVAYLYKPEAWDFARSLFLYAASVPYGQRFESRQQLEAYLWQEYTRLESGYEFATGFPEHAVRPSV